MSAFLDYFKSRVCSQLGKPYPVIVDLIRNNPEPRQIFHKDVNNLCICDVLLNFQDDKKYYQMELVNRETNFNKVFSSAPNVGVLDPRSKVCGACGWLGRRVVPAVGWGGGWCLRLVGEAGGACGWLERRVVPAVGWGEGWCLRLVGEKGGACGWLERRDIVLDISAAFRPTLIRGNSLDCFWRIIIKNSRCKAYGTFCILLGSC